MGHRSQFIRPALFRAATLVFVFIAAASGARAQDVRGAISGHVLDPSGARVPRATVTLRAVATNVVTPSRTNEEGGYAFLYLAPGTYALTVEAPGYKTARRDDINVRAQEQIVLDVPLTLGELAQVVDVTAETPLLETSTASAGTHISQRLIMELPMPEGNPVTLARYSTGIVWTGNPTWNQPYANTGSAGILAAGMNQRNEFTLDNIPNSTRDDAARVIYVPPQDLVQEVRVSTMSYDAEQGHTTGASVNLATRSGTSEFHGTAYYQWRNESLSANTFANNKNGVAKGAVYKRQPGGSIGGPVLLPKLYDGRDKTFFFFTYENIRESTSTSGGTGYFTVPTAETRNGDFSAILLEPLETTLTADGPLGSRGTVVPVTNPLNSQQAHRNMIYNPFSATKLASWVDPYSNRAVADKVFRTPFPNNIIPASLISPIAKELLKYYPEPNTAGDINGQNNYYSSRGFFNRFYTFSARVDHNFNTKNRSYGRVYHNQRLQNESVDWTQQVNGVTPSGSAVDRFAWGASYDHVYTPSSTLVLNLRAGFAEWGRNWRPFTYGVLGAVDFPFSGQFLKQVGPEKFLPGIGGNGFSSIGGGTVRFLRQYKYAFQPNVNWFKGDHRIKFGYDYRIDLDNDLRLGNSQGNFTFDATYTRGPSQDSGSMPGQGLASLLLGLPSGGSLGFGQGRANRMTYHGFYFQDDWRVSSRLTLNLGVRYEFVTPPTERYDRNIAGFDPNIRTSPELEAFAAARTYADPASGRTASKASYTDAVNAFRTAVPAWSGRFPSELVLKGGVVFNDANRRGFFPTDKNNVLPRFGVAYRLNQKTVLRGGTGFASEPGDLYEQISYTSSLYEINTPLYASVDNGLTLGPNPACGYCGNLANPFPMPQVTAQGKTFGYLTQTSGTLPGLRKNARFQNWSVGLQRELAGRARLELNYVGNRSWDRNVPFNLNAIPAELLSTRRDRDQELINRWSTQTPNPLRYAPQLPPTSGLYTSSTITVDQLLRAYPFMGAINQNSYEGTSTYNAAQVSFEKQFGGGILLITNYSFSKTMQRLGRLNQFDRKLEKVISGQDYPHVFHAAGIVELPFGRHRRFGSGWGRFLDGFLGGWQLGWTLLKQSGNPLSVGNIYYDGSMDLRSIKIKYDRKAVRMTSSNAAVQNQIYQTQWNGANFFGVPISSLPFYIKDAATCAKDASGACIPGQFDTQRLIQDSRTNLSYNIRTLPPAFTFWRNPGRFQWDMSAMKKIFLAEKRYLELRTESINVPNNPFFASPVFDPRNLAFGTLADTQFNNPRYFVLQAKFIF